MEFEREKQSENLSNVQVASETQTKPETRLENLPRLEDLLKSEKEVKQQQKFEGLKKVESDFDLRDKEFARESDKKKALVRKRVKIVTTVYATVLTLLLTFVGINIATMVQTQREINQKEIQIANLQGQIKAEPSTTPGTGTEVPTIEVTLNEPRDYSDDRKELTFFDKITILFRNLFG